jgi:hypothetical protein
MQRLVKEESLEVLQPGLNTNPRVYYKNLHLMTTCFVSGSVVIGVEGVEECAKDAEVVLSQDGSEIARATTDMFGEFKIDKLGKQSGPYDLQVNLDSSGTVSASFDVGNESVYLGVMAIES